MKKLLVWLPVCLVVATTAAAQGPIAPPPPVPGTPPAVLTRPKTVYITPTEDGFQTYLAAALTKKFVGLTMVTKPEAAQYVLTSTTVAIHKESGASKFARCMFAYCAGISDSGSTSVTLTQGDDIVWSYAVNKGRGQKNHQALAEAVAKHLKDDYLAKHR
jgi:hypothetical protein